MATRVVEGKKPYTGGKAIEIDENKVISLRLRDENNLIIWDEGDNEIYVDLQLDDEITPTSAFPVGITTGRVIVDNGWDEAGTIICAKTTSGDNIKLLYADSGNLYIDNGTGTFKQIYLKADVDALLLALRSYIDDELAKKQNGVASATAPINPSEGDLWYDTVNDQLQVYDGTQWTGIGGGGGTSNVKVFNLQSDQDLTTAFEAFSWAMDGKVPVITFPYALGVTKIFTMSDIRSGRVEFISPTLTGNGTASYSFNTFDRITILADSVSASRIDVDTINISGDYLELNNDYAVPYTPAYDGSPATKKYVDDSIISTQTGNLLQSGMKIWAGTESDYSSLSSYDSNTLYLTV